MLTIQIAENFVREKLISSTLRKKALIFCAVLLFIATLQADTHFCLYQNEEEEWISLLTHVETSNEFDFKRLKITTFSRSDEIQSFEQQQIVKILGEKISDNSPIICLHNCEAFAVWFMALFIIIF
ncbi:hypothetical protein ENUP19_0003G0066 [Entamoeba nuttalli]|uniref:Uncharacterized protein n=2 Tax=Entamoeba nuttalli TaxID=412467 RepID=K2G9L3_ENTNP|nr:hypothetical protein ENU1_141280 [Entamoeba nuttalli P19]EKE39121.1 hypothetical protein ENU1_141280 [Entamoeba nuttalli P19]|eukprot:XP_008858549.1 hypothetical protein ENU1_141280 [Entamoeba nuttalli P19]